MMMCFAETETETQTESVFGARMRKHTQLALVCKRGREREGEEEREVGREREGGRERVSEWTCGGTK